MPKEKTAEDIYFSSAQKLRTSLPKFIIFLGAAFLVWIFGTVLLIPLGHNIFVFNVEASKIINVIVITAILVLIFISFQEIKNVADASAGFVTYFIGDVKNQSEARIEKLQRTFRSLAYVILVSVIFLMFRGVLDLVHPALSGIIVIIISIWVIISLYAVIMAMSSEIEEAARSFANDIAKKAKRRKF